MKKLFLLIFIPFHLVLMTSAQVNLQEGLYAHYTFKGNLRNSGTNYFNSGISTYDLVSSGGEYSTGRSGYLSAYKFNGTSDYLISSIVPPNLFHFNIGTISFWVNLHEFPSNNPDQECVFLGVGGGTMNNKLNGLGIHCQKDSIVVADYGDNRNVTNSSYKLQLDKWYHVVVVRSQYNFYLYINDSLKSSGSFPYNNYQGYLEIGSMQFTAYTGRTKYFNGKIDDVRVYSRELNEREIHVLYTQPKDVDPEIINCDTISICSANSIVARANKDSSYTYQWLKDGIEISGATTDTLVITEPGAYRVKETNQYGNTDISLPKIVNKSVVVNDVTMQCGDVAQLVAQVDYKGSDSLIYLWSPPEGLNSNKIANPIADIVNSKTYKVIVTMPNGCIAADSLHVTVDPIRINASDATILCGTDAQLEVTSNYYGTKELFYNWTPSEYLNDPHISNPIAIKPKSTVYSVEVSTSNGCVVNKNIVLNTSNDMKPYTGLLAYYPFNGNLNDQSGRGSNLIASGGRYSSDRFGNISAYELNGTSEYLANDTLFSIKEFSLSFWVNMHEFPLNNPGQECVFMGLGGTENKEMNGLGIHCYNDTIVVADYKRDRNITHSSYKLQSDKWYHIIVTSNYATITYRDPAYGNSYNTSYYINLYINDTLRSNGHYTASSSYYWLKKDKWYYNNYPTGYSGNLQLGSMKYTPTAERKSFFNGKIDDVMFFNRTLNTQEIHNIYTDRASSGLHASICMVSVNESDKNIVTWQKYQNYGIDSTYIYRESLYQPDQYDLIGKLPYSRPGIFIDSASNAEIQSNKYKILFKDKCGYESEKSQEHRTMHLTINKGEGNVWNLSWEQYLGIPVKSYKIYRGTSKSNLSLIDSTSGSNSSYTDVFAPSGSVYYQVRIDLPQDWSNPKPVEFASSVSNIVSKFDFIKSLSNEFSDYTFFNPNPADNVIYISGNISTKSLVFIYNMSGELILKKQIDSNNSIDISDLSPGIYIVKIDNSREILTKKLIKK
jgi:hypothetical protein